MLGEEKHMPPEGSAARDLCQLIDAHPVVTLRALGITGLTSGEFAHSLEVVFADGREVQIELI